MTRHIVIVGAGLIGATLAYRLARLGARVTLIDRSGPAAGASGASFGWINASFYVDLDHHHLRVAGIAAHRRLQADLPDLEMAWQPTLWFEAQGAGLVRMAKSLQELNYPVEHLDRQAFCALAPDVAAPDAALCFTSEGVADPALMNRQVFDAALSRGARAVLGVAVKALVQTRGRVSGVATDHGVIEADDVVIAAGSGAADLIGLPMLPRPGLLMKTNALPPVLAHVLVTPEGEIKQDSTGRLVMPTAINHQADATTQIEQTPDRLADAALVRLQSLFPKQELRWEEVALAHRPVPQDGLPVIGKVEDGLYAAVMHSGVTLAAITAEYAARELLDGAQVSALSPYRPGRFSQISGRKGRR